MARPKITKPTRTQGGLRPARSALACGLTGSGKSRLISEFLKDVCKEKRKSECFYLINGRASDYLEHKHLIRHVTFDELAQRKKETGQLLSDKVTVLIWEDLSHPEKKEQKVLKEILCKTKRHQNLNVFVVVHNISANQMSYLHAHFDDIFFTFGIANASNWKHFSRVHCPDLMENGAVKGFFSKDNVERRYFHYDVGTKNISFYHHDFSPAATVTSAESDISATEFVAKYLQCQDRGAGILLFDYLKRVLGSTRFLHGSTFEIHTVNDDNGRTQRCSILDVLSVASSNGVDATPLEASIFEALAKIKSIPRSLVRNAKLHKFLGRDIRSDSFEMKKKRKTDRKGEKVNSLKGSI